MIDLCNNRVVYSQFVARDVVMMVNQFKEAGILAYDRDASVLGREIAVARLNNGEVTSHDETSSECR